MSEEPTTKIRAIPEGQIVIKGYRKVVNREEVLSRRELVKGHSGVR